MLPRLWCVSNLADRPAVRTTGLFSLRLMLFGEFVFRFLQLLLERGVGVQCGNNGGTDDARGIYVALPVVTANHAALAQLIPTF